MGYSFSVIHALAYSFVGMQTLYLATHFNPVYWNTACLIVNSGALDPEKGDSTDYSKIAKAIGAIQQAGIKVSLADINHSDFGFTPDVQNNQILFGLKGILNVGDEIVQTIIDNRPYSSPKDFLQRVNVSKQTMIALIKSGAFDNMYNRKFVMAWYIWETCDKKSRLTLQNLPSLIKYNLIPLDTEDFKLSKRVYEFNRYLKAITKIDPCRYVDYYTLDNRAINFLNELSLDEIMETDNLVWFVKQKTWDKIYQKYMDIFRDWITNNKEEILASLNTAIFTEDWNKYAKGNISAWEMEVLCFYYHDHELKNVNNEKYGFVNFFDLPEEPMIERSFITRSGAKVNIFKLQKICGTCIAKDKTKCSVSLLTNNGVVNVKFRKEYFSMFDKQISIKQPDGTKKIAEKSWFNRGNMIVVQGFRSEDTFITKKYAASGGHQLYRIEQIVDNGDLVLTNQRYQGGIEEDEV